ncbi:DUF4255 domain-containing protein [Mucilaginibacter sp.]|uniref:DUF4255 domain-containing protein n=1 Tax=Mucilaginibacter sp. TaxID=1882438 RepID=UPI0026064EF5|nr:DUF4255 domain-containing protein [Mucilaginibacter sp.]MDB4918386.1 hypothetical protein [Mucilaginibacter sp.]
MIDEVLITLKDKLNEYVCLKTDHPEDTVVFPDGSKLDPSQFPLNNITPILINIEEEKSIRSADRFSGVVRNGLRTEVNPSIPVNLLILFVVRFADYEQSMKILSLIIRFFQRNRVFDHANTPTLSPELSKFTMELQALPLAEQNELWNSLRSAYQPSLLYKVSMLVFNDKESIQVIRDVNKVELDISI